MHSGNRIHSPSERKKNWQNDNSKKAQLPVGMRSIFTSGQKLVKKKKFLGQPRWRSGLAPPAARGLILGTLDRVPHQAPCMEPDVGLDPRYPGSRPGLQAALNRCATRAAQIKSLKKNFFKGFQPQISSGKIAGNTAKCYKKKPILSMVGTVSSRN